MQMKQTTDTQKQNTKQTKQKQYGRKVNIQYKGKSPKLRKKKHRQFDTKMRRISAEFVVTWQHVSPEKATSLHSWLAAGTYPADGELKQVAVNREELIIIIITTIIIIIIIII
jgi:hypothetical protein